MKPLPEGTCLVTLGASKCTNTSSNSFSANNLKKSSILTSASSILHSSTTDNGSDSDSENNWDFGIGDLVIDLDVDSEKSGGELLHHHENLSSSGASSYTTPNYNSSMTSMTAGNLKMKIKRKPAADASGSQTQVNNSNVYSDNKVNEIMKNKNISRNNDKNGSKNRLPSKKVAKVVKPGAPQGSTSSAVSQTSMSESEGERSQSTEDLSSEGRYSSAQDPYEFSDKLEDKPVYPGKKVKIEKNDASCSPMSVHSDVTDVKTLTSECDPPLPCEHGAPIQLDGTVWHETNNGMLVVNMIWRGRSYCGTLLDHAQHAWASPRWTDGSSTTDIDQRRRKGKRTRRGTEPISYSEKKGRQTRSSTTTKIDKRKRRVVDNDMICDSQAKKSKPQGRTTCTAAAAAAAAAQAESAALQAAAICVSDEAGYYICPEINCNKKYRQINGLKYHTAHAHTNYNETNNNTFMDTKEFRDIKKEEEDMDIDCDKITNTSTVTSTINTIPVSTSPIPAEHHKPTPSTPVPHTSSSVPHTSSPVPHTSPPVPHTSPPVSSPQLCTTPVNSPPANNPSPSCLSVSHEPVHTVPTPVKSSPVKPDDSHTGDVLAMTMGKFTYQISGPAVNANSPLTSSIHPSNQTSTATVTSATSARVASGTTVSIPVAVTSNTGVLVPVSEQKQRTKHEKVVDKRINTSNGSKITAKTIIPDHSGSSAMSPLKPILPKPGQQSVMQSSVMDRKSKKKRNREREKEVLDHIERQQHVGQSQGLIGKATDKVMTVTGTMSQKQQQQFRTKEEASVISALASPHKSVHMATNELSNVVSKDLCKMAGSSDHYKTDSLYESARHPLKPRGSSVIKSTPPPVSPAPVRNMTCLSENHSVLDKARQHLRHTPSTTPTSPPLRALEQTPDSRATDVPSPAYSDISDANDTAPLSDVEPLKHESMISGSPALNQNQYPYSRAPFMMGIPQQSALTALQTMKVESDKSSPNAEELKNVEQHEIARRQSEYYYRGMSLPMNSPEYQKFLSSLTHQQKIMERRTSHVSETDKGLDAAMREKKQENQQILKENMEVKHQMQSHHQKQEEKARQGGFKRNDDIKHESRIKEELKDSKERIQSSKGVDVPPGLPVGLSPQGFPVPPQGFPYFAHPQLMPYGMQFDPNNPMFRGVNPLMYPPGSFMHTGQLRFPVNMAPVAPEKEKVSRKNQSPSPSHKIYELADSKNKKVKEEAGTGRTSASPRTYKTPPPQRHLHTHHHTHVVGNPYQGLYDYGPGGPPAHNIQRSSSSPNVPTPRQADKSRV